MKIVNDKLKIVFNRKKKPKALSFNYFVRALARNQPNIIKKNNIENK